MLITKDEAQSANFHAFHGGPPHALARPRPRESQLGAGSSLPLTELPSVERTANPCSDPLCMKAFLVQKMLRKACLCSSIRLQQPLLPVEPG
jgi:hypothetical protein